MPFDFSAYRVASGEKPASSTKFNNFLQAVQDAVNGVPPANLLGFPSDATKFLDGSGGWSVPITDQVTRYVKTSQTDVTSATPGDLFGGGITIAANKLGASGAIRIFASGTLANTGGTGTRAVTLRLKLGTTTMWDSGVSDQLGTATAPRPWFFIGVIQALGSISSQIGGGWLAFGDTNAVPTGFGKISDQSGKLATPVHTIATPVNMSASRALILECQFNGAGATMSCFWARAEVTP